MRNLKNDESSSSNRFIPNADRIREKINQANRDGKWRGQMPIGPLGDFMKLKPGFDKFIGTAEYLIGSYLRSYICFDSGDERSLRKLLESQMSKQQISITTMRWDDGDIAAHPKFKKALVEHPEYPTIYKMFEFTHPMAKRYLVEFGSIHMIPIVPTLKEALDVVQNKRKLNFCYTFNLDRVETTRAMTKNATPQVARYFTADKSQYISQLNSEIVDLKRKIDQQSSLVIELTKKLSDNEKELRKAQKESTGGIDHRALNSEKQKHQNWIDSNAVNDGDNYFDDEIREKEERIRRAEESIEKLSEEYQKAKDLVAERQKFYAEKKKEVEKQQKEYEEAKKRAGNVLAKQEEFHNRKNYYMNKVKEHKKKLDEHQSEVAKAKYDLQRAVSKAQQLCERPEQIPQNEELEREKIRSLEERADRAEQVRIMKDGPIWKEQFETLSESLSENKQLRKLKKKIIAKIKELLNERVACFEDLKCETAKSVEEQFKIVADINKYCGKMLINHEEKTLSMLVIRYDGDAHKARNVLDQKKAQGQVDNIASLSGGEKSITTICFLMAVWSNIKTPIRCMDEFDVFMDSHHKQLATNILCQQAARTPATQYIFLTPTGTTNSEAELKKKYKFDFKFNKLVPPRDANSTSG